MSADTLPCLNPPEITPVRLERLEEWVAEYAAGVRATWVENGEDVDSPEGRHTLLCVAESMRCSDIPKWMPLSQALAVKIQMEFSPETVKPDTLRNALRTLNTATQDETDAAICNQMGWDQLSLNNFRQRHAEYTDHQESSSDRDGDCSLYRYYDSSGRLLYVGIAADPNMRDNQHRVNSKWHQFHADRKVEWHRSRGEAGAAERAAITAEEPIFNLTHASPRQREAALNYLFDRLADR